MRSIRTLFLLLIFPFFVYAQEKRETDAGAALSVEIQKNLVRNFNLSLEEEVRLIDNRIGFDRSVTSVGIDYALFNNKIKVGGYYAFLYLYNNDYRYEMRHRYYLNISYKETINSFTLSWRGRLQGTSRDEDRGSYKINPKYMMKNKLQVEYTIFGSPWKPFTSCDIYTELNNPKGNEIPRIRYQGGVSWRMNRTDYLEFYLRYDDNFSEDDPKTVMIGVGYKIKL